MKIERIEFPAVRVLYNRRDDGPVRRDRRTIWGDLTPEADGFRRAEQDHVPYTYGLFILSKDGRAVDSLEGGVGRLGGVPSDRFGQLELRATVDAFVAGGGTLRRDRAIGAPVEPELLEMRIKRKGNRAPVNAFFSASGDVPLDAGVFRAPEIETLLFVTSRAADRLTDLKEAASEVVMVEPKSPLTQMWRELRRRGHSTVGFEGGPVMMGMALRERLVHELLLTHSSALLGGTGSGLVADGPALHGVSTRPVFLGLDERSGLIFERNRVLYSDETRPHESR